MKFSMKQIISMTLSFVIFVWILPLGIFIKSSQEKTACGGKRAFHMCGKSMSQPKDSSSQKISFTSTSGVEKTNQSASSSGDNSFTNSTSLIKVQDKVSQWVGLDLILPRQLFFPVPTPIPKV